jgi:photosystem II stability/assembly factor-like uncharacterized protein
MTEEDAFAAFHSALDTEPPPGAWERLRAALAEEVARPRRRPQQLAWQPALRPLAAAAAALLIVAVAAAAFLWHSTTVSPAGSGHVTVPNRPVAVYSSAFVSASTGWVVAAPAPGSDPAVYFTRDGGGHWTRQVSMGKDEVATYTRAFDDRHLVLVVAGPNQARLVVTEDGGAHFRLSDLPSVAPHSAVSFLTPARGWTVISGDVYATNDGGVSWRQVSTAGVANGFDGQEEANSSWIEFVDATTGFLGMNVFQGLPRLHVTHDGGQTWTAASIAYPPGLDLVGGRAGFGAPAGFVDSRQGTLPFYYLPSQSEPPSRARW